MPIQWTISHPDRRVTAVCTEVVTRADLEAYLDNVVVEGALPYAKIVELGDATSGPNDDDMMALGARIQAYVQAATAAMGPLAVVAVSRRQYEYAQIFAALATARRPLKIFRNLQLARKWLDSVEARP